MKTFYFAKDDEYLLMNRNASEFFGFNVDVVFSTALNFHKTMVNFVNVIGVETSYDFCIQFGSLICYHFSFAFFDFKYNFPFNYFQLYIISSVLLRNN